MDTSIQPPYSRGYATHAARSSPRSFGSGSRGRGRAPVGAVIDCCEIRRRIQIAALMGDYRPARLAGTGGRSWRTQESTEFSHGDTENTRSPTEELAWVGRDRLPNAFLGRLAPTSDFVG